MFIPNVARFWSALAALVLTVATASSQPLAIDYDSLELCVADSDLIVRGKIVRLTSEDFGRKMHRVTLRVDETLKGEKLREVRLLISPGKTTEEGTPAHWQNDDIEVLAFLKRSDPGDAPRERYAPRSGTLQRSFLTLEADSPVQIYTSRLTPLFRREEILLHTREALGKTPRHREAQPHLVAIPAGSSNPADPPHPLTVDVRLRDRHKYGHLPWGDYPRVWVPVDPRLEPIAREWIGDEEPYLRIEGARALRYFRSPRNIESLRALLEDPYSIGGSPNPENRAGRLRYLVREAAEEVLREWGILR